MLLKLISTNDLYLECYQRFVEDLDNQCHRQDFAQNLLQFSANQILQILSTPYTDFEYREQTIAHRLVLMTDDEQDLKNLFKKFNYQQFKHVFSLHEMHTGETVAHYVANKSPELLCCILRESHMSYCQDVLELKNSRQDSVKGILERYSISTYNVGFESFYFYGPPSSGQDACCTLS